ncbi:MAG TPA: hypothetical protein VLC98_10455 [Phnomibacter sp.]|nr:hypothetical protein [Phnomibacter sp.]
MKKGVLLLLVLMGIGAQLMAQESQFKVMISNNRLHPGDTLDMEVEYSIGDRKLPPATFALTILGPANKVWQMRWPLVEGKAEASVVLPDSLPAGRYNLLFAVQPRFLKLFGELIFPDKVKTLKAVVQNSVGVQTLEIKPDARRKFVVDNLYVEESVSIKFFHDNNRVDAPPLVKLEAWLDSSFTPAAYRVAQVVVNEKGRQDLEPEKLSKDSVFSKGFDALYDGYAQRQAVKQMQHMSAVEIYDSLYVAKSFKTKATKVYDCTVDSVANAANTIFELLKAEMPGMDVMVWGEPGAEAEFERSSPTNGRPLASETMIQWKDNLYRLYHNKKYGNGGLLIFPPSAFAKVMVIDPPTIKALSGKKGVTVLGTIAFFERKWPLEQPFPFNNQFTVKGYTPPVYLLPLQ